MGLRSAALAGSVTLAMVVGGCTTGRSPEAARTSGDPAEPSSRRSSSGRSSAGPSPTTVSPAPPSTATQSPPATPDSTKPATFDAAAALADVRILAGEIGPRLATSAAYREAGRVVEGRFEELGYAVRQETFDVPAGDSWGVPVDAGRSFNVVAEPPEFDPAQPHVVLGAHLDTVAVAPGAEDNASGVAVLLEIARLAATGRTRLPAVLIAFGAEEPRGPGDDMHHFGSQHHVRQLSPHPRGLTAMVSLDRVGVGSVVPVCTGPLSPPRVQEALLRAAARTGVPAKACENTASDHWSFEKAGFAVARLGSTSYAAYHSAEDLPDVVSRQQLGRTGRLVWAWLR